MPERLLFPDAHAAADALTFAGRAARLGDDSVRLTAADGILVLTAAALAGQGLGDATPTVLGMRMLPVDPELVCDIVVEAAALARATDAANAVLLPDLGRSPAWAGVSPPRHGWTPVGGIPASVVATRAQWGIAAVAGALPRDPGEDVVRSVRASVWGEPDDDLADLPLGVAFAAHGLGFIGGDETARVFTAGPWRRLSFARGHVVTRGPQRAGLTPVRETGRVRR